MLKAGSIQSLLAGIDPVKRYGRVTRAVGLTIEGTCPEASIGSVCRIKSGKSDPGIEAEIVGFKENKAILMPLGEVRGVGFGSTIEVSRECAMFPAGEELLGRVVDGLGNPLDGKGPLNKVRMTSIYNPCVQPLSRSAIKMPLDVGVRSINGMLTICKGQRMGIMAGSGVGKSTLMGMMARHTSADVRVIALIGERGREVGEFLEHNLTRDALKKSVVVVATADQPAVVRMRGAYAATAIAETFSSDGRDVLLMMDSITRFMMALREIGLAAGEPPTARGYTPSAFSTLPRLVERAGAFEGGGSITGLYTVLVEGDDFQEPVADAVRSVIDGHIVLSRDLASRGQYPPVDVLGSVSRVMSGVVGSRHDALSRKLRELLAVYRDAEDLVNLGAYKKGANPHIDEALDKIEAIKKYLKQDVNEKVDFDQSVNELAAALGAGSRQ